MLGKRTSLAAAVALALPVFAFAADTLAHADSSFVKDAAEAGLFEVQAAQVAQQKGNDPQVKTFAQTMIDDHTKANQELESLAQQKGVTLPTSPSVTQKAKLGTLNHWTKSGFDHHYADDQVSAHKDAVKLFTKESTDSKDADLKAWAAKTLPTLQHHLEMAQQLASETKSSSGMSAPAASR
jgi:putative membrane protein